MPGHDSYNYDSAAQRYGFRDTADLNKTFNNNHLLHSYYSHMFDTMDKIKRAYAKEQSAPEVYNWRDTLTFGLVDGRTRKQICRDNLNKYLDVVQHDFGMSDDQMKKLCKNLGVPVNEKGRLAMNSDVDVNPIGTDTRLTMAFNSPPDIVGAAPGMVQGITRTGPQLALAT
jgi:hypothetical protein